MEDQVEVAPSAATDEAVAVEQAASEATVNTEGQVETPPAADEAEKSASKERRERRKAHDARLREEADAARREADDLRRRNERIVAAAAGEAPMEAEFTDPLEYAAAKGAFLARQMAARTDAEMLSQDATAAEQRARQLDGERIAEKARAFAEQREEARSRYADLDAAMSVAQRADVVSPQLAEMVLESESPVDLAYHLGKNPALARQISQMPPVMAARELGRLEARLTLPQPKTQSTAPAPISPVKATGTATRDPARMSANEYRAWREAGGKF